MYQKKKTGKKKSLRTIYKRSRHGTLQHLVSSHIYIGERTKLKLRVMLCTIKIEIYE